MKFNRAIDNLLRKGDVVIERSSTKLLGTHNQPDGNQTISVSYPKNDGTKFYYTFDVCVERISPLFYSISFEIKFSTIYDTLLLCENPKFKFPRSVRKFLKQKRIGSYSVTR